MVYFETFERGVWPRLELVSILVLMDGVLRAGKSGVMMYAVCSFNPCSNGWCTSRGHDPFSAGVLKSFNPCSNGWCTSSAPPEGQPTQPEGVSILVLMDGVLRAECVSEMGVF